MTAADDIDSWLRCQGICARFLYEEAELLDQNRLFDWLDLLTEDIQYRIPVRITQERTTPDNFSSTSFHINEGYATLKARIDRLETEYDWSEDPPSRTRRHISNVRGESTDDDTIACTSNLLVFRSRGDTTDHRFISAKREDVLVETDEGWRLDDRRVLLDQTILNTHNLAILL